MYVEFIYHHYTETPESISQPHVIAQLSSSTYFHSSHYIKQDWCAVAMIWSSGLGVRIQCGVIEIVVQWTCEIGDDSSGNVRWQCSSGMLSVDTVHIRMHVLYSNMWGIIHCTCSGRQYAGYHGPNI